MWVAFYVANNNGANFLPPLSGSGWRKQEWPKQPQRRGRRGNGANADAATSNNNMHRERPGKPNLRNMAMQYGAKMGGNQQ